MALFKAVVWALIFLTKLRFPPGVSIAIVMTVNLYILHALVCHTHKISGDTTKFVVCIYKTNVHVCGNAVRKAYKG